ncbi:hypothetical protein E1B28_011005 [Marasmius oreades]|uniref:Uncharacterized protein n=1 Tax=Marasmius oreades TaxID=181124 RepID=A0A9P7RT84_9AGAR|nr:uncharacterized protein E1B28_011005 [Marasmius oreades]KAG7089309.1 hypothetical protein E1B28_011005 [Marasmius oreades]
MNAPHHPDCLSRSMTSPGTSLRKGLPKAGDIYCVNMSIYEPYFRLLDRLSHSPNNDDGACILPLPSQTSSKGYRPCIILDVLDDGLYSICLMATFDRKARSQLPRCFDPFAIPVFTCGASDEAIQHGSEHLHTSPEWDSASPQTLVAIPFRCTLSTLERRWRSNVIFGAGCVVEDLETLKRMIATRMDYWREYISTGTERRIEQYYDHLISHRKKYSKWKLNGSGTEGSTTASSCKRTQHRQYSVCTGNISMAMHTISERETDGKEFTIVQYGSAWNKFASRSRIHHL